MAKPNQSDPTGVVVSGILIQQVWDKARAMPEQDPSVWRRDECGAWMRREHYGHADSEYSWRIENISLGGPDTPENLRAYHRDNTYDRSNGHAKCRMTADQTGVDVRERVMAQPRNRQAGG